MKSISNNIKHLIVYSSRQQFIIYAIMAFAVFILASGCKKSNDNTPPPPPPSPIQVQLATNASLGKILTDKDGRTLYYFANDASGTSTCSGGCEAVWPAFTIDAITADKFGDGLNVADFGTTTNASGKTQLVYKGRPLYYYAPDVSGTNTPEAPGETTGENVGGIWFVAKPDYTIMLTNAQLVGHDGKNYTSDYTEGTGKTLYFTDGNGITLYTFINDKFDKNNFTKPDFSNDAIWPIYQQGDVVAPSSLDASLFNTIDVYGKTQLTYKGWPLYYFGQDAMVMGANKGISFPVPGIWPVPVKDIAPATP